MPTLMPSRKYIRTYRSGKIPNGLALKDTGSPILILVCSVEVEKYRLFVDVKGYSAGGATWTIDFTEIEGDTSQFNGPWDALKDYIQKPFFSIDGRKKYNICITLINANDSIEDSWIYAFTMKYLQGVYACKVLNSGLNEPVFSLFSKDVLKACGLSLAFIINGIKIEHKVSVFKKWKQGDYQPEWYPNFPNNLGDYYHSFDNESVEFQSYRINLAALEIWANDWCRLVLKLKSLDWRKFWKSAIKGFFYEKIKRCKYA